MEDSTVDGQSQHAYIGGGSYDLRDFDSTEEVREPLEDASVGFASEAKHIGRNLLGFPPPPKFLVCKRGVQPAQSEADFAKINNYITRSIFQVNWWDNGDRWLYAFAFRHLRLELCGQELGRGAVSFEILLMQE